MASPERLAPREGLVTRALLAWGDLSASTRTLIAERPSESTLLVIAMLSGLFHFLGTLAGLWLSPEARTMTEGALLSRVGGEFAGAVVFRTLGLYAIAALVAALARAAGGTGGYADSRVALFWAALVAAPPMLAVTVGGALAGPYLGAGAAAGIAAAGGLIFAWTASQAIAAAHAFRRGWPIFVGLVILAGAIAALARATGGAPPV